MAAKDYLIPGFGVVNEKQQDEQFLIPGFGVTDEEQSGVTPPTLTPVLRRRREGY